VAGVAVQIEVVRGMERTAAQGDGGEGGEGGSSGGGGGGSGGMDGGGDDRDEEGVGPHIRPAWVLAEMEALCERIERRRDRAAGRLAETMRQGAMWDGLEAQIRAWHASPVCSSRVARRRAAIMAELRASARPYRSVGYLPPGAALMMAQAAEEARGVARRGR
jgi:hypothetical protein